MLLTILRYNMIKLEKLYAKVNDYYKIKKSEKYTFEAYIENKLLNDDNYVALSNKIGKLNFDIAKLDFDGNTNEANDLKILRDNYLLEVFVNGGEEVYSVLL